MINLLIGIILGFSISMGFIHYSLVGLEDKIVILSKQTEKVIVQPSPSVDALRMLGL